ncbi:class I glutamine amidotransferase-like protein [Mycena epipterygia]|nr:class I glutamine amidotransferase-like protein [Mycena epipterygia]
MPSILFVLTSAAKTLTGAHTGWYLPEAAHPYYILAPHANIDFASPAGANPPIDPTSVKLFASDAECTKFLADEEVQRKLASAKKLSEVSSKDYDAIFYVGGHGPPIDLAVDPINIKLTSEFFQAGKVTSAVCHGPAALVGVTDAEGKSIFAGRSATGFTNAEETQIDKVKAKVVVDGHLITGQNPNSAKFVGEAILKALK